MGPERRRVRELPRRAWRDVATRVRVRWRSALTRALRLTGAAVLAYVVALAVTTSSPPLTACWSCRSRSSAPSRTARSGSSALVAGVLLAVLFAAVTALTWWTLSLLIAASIVVGQLLRLGEHLLEVPISAMLVLAVGQVESAALSRIGETLLGAAVGVTVSAYDLTWRFGYDLTCRSSARSSLGDPSPPGSPLRFSGGRRGR